MAAFEHGPAAALGDPSMRLAVQEHRIDRTSDIVDHGLADDFDSTGFGLDLDLADLCATREAGDRLCLVGDRGERQLSIAA